MDASAVIPILHLEPKIFDTSKKSVSSLPLPKGLPNGHPTLLSFINLVELHVLAAIRRKHTVPMPKVRNAIEYLRRNTRKAWDKKHPLISKQLETNGLDLFIERYGELVNISRDGQLAMREVMSAALQRIECGPVAHRPTG